MTYQAQESSVEAGQPVEIYTFTVGTTPFRYTSAEDEQTFSGITWEPLPLKRGTLPRGPEERDLQLPITLPSSVPLPRLFALVIPGARVGVLIERFHRTDLSLERRKIFEGYVQSVAWTENGKLAVFSCRPSISVRSCIIPRYTYAAHCGNVLYDENCQVDITHPAFRVSAASVSAIDGRTITVPGLSGFGDDWFTGGFVETIGVGDFRWITSHVGDDLELLLPFAEPPTTVNVLAGCDYTHDGPNGCGPKFDNGDHYGGFGFIPKRNPHESGL